MVNVLSSVLPLFFMITCGFLIVRCNLIGRDSVHGLIGLVFWLFLPCFIFSKTLGARDYSIDWRVLGAYYLACACVFFLAAIGGKLLFGGSLRIGCLRGLTAISGVVGYMGLPLVTMMFEKEAIMIALAITMADNLLILAGGSLMMEFTASSDQLAPKYTELIASTSKGIFTNPLIVSVLLAGVFIITGINLPDPLLVFSTHMSNATGPIALVALGAALAAHTQKNIGKTDIVLLALLKTIALPLLVYISCRYIFELNGLQLKVAVLMAALPVASNVLILASRYQTYELPVSGSMLLSVVLGLLSISLLIGLFPYFAVF
jgi:malonate transporter and related proteins